VTSQSGGVNKPLSDTPKKTSAVGALGLFGVIAIAAFCFTTVRPVVQIILARGWKATPCVVVDSSVKRHPGRQNSTYSVNIVYTYEAGGHKLTGSRYHFMGGSSGGYSGKAAVVARYPRGKHTVCYVNPRDPSDSVIERGFTADMWVGLVPLLFLGVAVWAIFATSRAANNPKKIPWQPATLQDDTDLSAVPTEPRELAPEATPMKTFVAFLLFALFWNGIVSVFVYQAFHSAHFTGNDWFGALFSGGQLLFMVPFVLVGLVLVIAVVSCFLALFNPRVHLKVSPGAVVLGDAILLEWTIQGNVNRLSRFRVMLEGREEANYRSRDGESMNTSNEVFARIAITDTTERGSFSTGMARATVPRDSMHSFDTGNNKIKWKLVVQGTIPRWADMKEEYPILVLPLKKGAA